MPEKIEAGIIISPARKVINLGGSKAVTLPKEWVKIQKWLGRDVAKLAIFEIQHVSGEIEEETYQREISLLSTGLETARQELNAIKEAMEKLASPPQTAESPTPQQTVKTENIESADVGKLEAETIELPTEAEPQALADNPPETQLTETKAEG